MNRALTALFLAAACGRVAPIIDPPVKRDPPITTQPLVGCDGHAVIALDGRRTLTRVDAAGSQPLYTFGAGLTGDEVSVMQWEVAGRFIGGFAFLSTKPQTTYDFVLMDAGGKVLWHQRREEPFMPSVFLGADGTLAVGGQTGFIAHADGTVTDLGDFAPMSPVLAGGAIVATRGIPWESGNPIGLWRDGTFTALSPQPLPYSGLHTVGAHAVYVTDTALVTAESGRAMPLPAKGFQVVASAAGRWVLLAAESESVVVDLDLGTAKSLSNLPETKERYSAWNAALDSAGAVLAGAQVGDQLQLERSADLGQTWSDVGAPMLMGEDFGLGRWLLPTEKQGSVLTLSMSTGYGHYVNAVQLTSSEGTHAFSTGGVYVNVDLSPGAVDLSGDGQCVAAWVKHDEGQPLELVFMNARGEQTRVLESEQLALLRFLP